MDKQTKIVLVIIVILVIGGIAAAVMATVKEKGQNGVPKLVLEMNSFDFGDVAMADGKITKNVKIKNDGNGDLKISKIITSCMCTEAFLEVDGRKSPAFGMPGHGNGPLFWSEIIKPGEEGNLEIVFDPNAHGPDAVGPITRNVIITSNDGGESGSTKTITFDGNVVKGEVKKTEPVNVDAEILSVSQSGVEVRVAKVTKQGGKTIVEFTADNHAVDLSTFDVKNQSSLAGQPASNYVIKDGGGGGHHLSAELIFNKELSGALIIGFNKNLIFNLVIK
ncbi:MAG: DUF1573 domain-containing protein [Candidatus Magasanikbacteria bacterium]|nr:DUF1573 domain-containing protein [Candidatus Magasanikbacteria bacterium]